jgi:hypothetical protein
MGGECGMYGKRNCVLVEKPEGKTLLGRLHIGGKVILKWMGWYELDSSGSGQCEVAGSCKPGFLTKGWEFLS